MDETVKARLAGIEANARAKVAEHAGPVRDKDFFKRTVIVPAEPIFIASSEDIGTPRVRANHVDACLDYCMEQEYLKRNKIPL
mmetsp:Transcript_39825/g.40615  ORF Transcript_39825/g.40615 Transcript_39825/m.40615 type:complete len:83 (+) Transcript_39825:115-363(+)|eukprot:CAMPEP_0182427080 /NCGR_PEP_ID=MMETSP1167-20130531/14137_1 /TAXON_ID=2988 /ORGANISM="Mallomonas Sp, Strain CCMP3275" /LENGTH=82 /DNA_ID=CAMNT_0024608959 /DNA_START=91 /DNA_END=339 /DNA_ORIENTATION=-